MVGGVILLVCAKECNNSASTTTTNMYLMIQQSSLGDAFAWTGSATLPDVYLIMFMYEFYQAFHQVIVNVHVSLPA